MNDNAEKYIDQQWLVMIIEILKRGIVQFEAHVFMNASLSGKKYVYLTFILLDNLTTNIVVRPAASL